MATLWVSDEKVTMIACIKVLLSASRERTLALTLKDFICR